MKLSIVIICWNDLAVIKDCLRSIVQETQSTEYEIIVSDNGSVDDSVRFIREHYPQVQVVENGANLGFAKGNNAGIRLAKGEYVLILNPDTIIQNRALDRWIVFADEHPEAGGFGCRVLNPDGSYQEPARPIPNVWTSLVAALYLRPLGRISSVFDSDLYAGWHGTTQRIVGYQSGCCVLFRSSVLSKLDGFDARFFYHYEETDLCYRCAKLGFPILFFPGAEIIHLGGQSVGRFPIRFELEKFRNKYRFFYKHYGARGARQIRRVTLLHLNIRRLGYSVLRLFKSSESLDNRLAKDRTVILWNRKLDPVRFANTGEEYDVGYEPLAPPANVTTANAPAESR
jgi:GT2 family glycosyltransferase